MRLRAVGVGKVFSSTPRKAWVSKGGLWYVDVWGGALRVDGSIRAGGLDELEEDWGWRSLSLEFGYRDIERDSFGSPSEDDTGVSEMFVWPPVCSPRRILAVGR